MREKRDTREGHGGFQREKKKKEDSGRYQT
jgi:hypothetical protein